MVDDGNGGALLIVTVYSYGPNGGQIFMIAFGPVVNGVAIGDVFITDGPLWGDNYDPEDFMETQWGTGVFSAIDCDTVHMVLTPNAEHVALGYTEIEYDMGRLAKPLLPCPAD